MFWQLLLLPAAFRGAPFKIASHAETDGRRLAKFEFPYRDSGSAEDLGKKLGAYKVRGYVIGEGYWLARDALRAALKTGGVGTLVHPYLGVLQVYPEPYTMTEDQQDGGRAIFEMSFVEAGLQPSPLGFADTAAAFLAALDTMNQVLAGNFGLLLPFLPSGLLPGIAVFAIGSALAGLVLGVASAFASLGSALIGPVLIAFAPIASAPSDPVATPALVLAAFASAVTQAIAAANPVLPPYDPVLGDTSDPIADAPSLADPSYGLAGLAAWVPSSAAQPAFGAAVTQQAQAIQAVTVLVQGAAVVAMAMVYAESTFPSANAAQAARTQLLGLIGAQATLAANLGADALYLAWTAVATAAAADLTQRVLNLPLLTGYSVGGSLPALVLAQRLYQDASRADELVQLNDAVHPLFMPAQGVCLSS